MYLFLAEKVVSALALVLMYLYLAKCTALQPICERVCDAVQAQSNTACVQDLLGSSFDHIALLSYSSGHIVESLAIILRAADNDEDVTFLSQLHLNDRGSPDDCSDVAGAHYCLGQIPSLASLGVCLPQICDSASVAAIVANLTALNPGSTSSSSSSSSSARALASSSSFACGDEQHIPVDAGTVIVLSLVAALMAFIVVGTALDWCHRRGRLSLYYPAKPGDDRQQENFGIRDVREISCDGGADIDPRVAINAIGDGHVAHETVGTIAGNQAGGLEEVKSSEMIKEQKQWRQEEQLETGAALMSTAYGYDARGEESGDSARAPLLARQRWWPVGATERLLGTDPDSCNETAVTKAPLELRQEEKSRWAASWWYHLLECFSLMRNADRLLAAPREGNVFGALDGVRTLSMLWVILGHTLLYALLGMGNTNTVDVLPHDGEGLLSRCDHLRYARRKTWTDLSAQVIPEAFFAVDTFFLMSAFLLSSTLLHKLETESLGRCAWMLKAYLHRYLRLTPTLAVVTFLTWKVLPLLGEGTGWWAQAAVKNDSCSKYWWVEITYLANVIPWPPLSAGCLGTTWYLANDTQFFIVGVPLVTLFHHRPRLGVMVAMLIIAASCGYTLLWSGFHDDVRFHFFSVSHADSKDGWATVYSAPWSRCPVYVMGLLCGFMWHSKCRSRIIPGDRSAVGAEGGHGRRGVSDRGPEEMQAQTPEVGHNSEDDAGNDSRGRSYQNVGNTSNGIVRQSCSGWEDTQQPKLPLFVGGAAITSAMLLALPVYGSYWGYQDATETGVAPWADHLYLAFSRPAWALGVAIMCALCFIGKGGLVNWALTRPGWTTPSRLTYCAYLTHSWLLNLLYGSRGNPTKLTWLEYSVTYMGTVMGTFALATALHLLVEAPFRNLESWARKR